MARHLVRIDMASPRAIRNGAVRIHRLLHSVVLGIEIGVRIHTVLGHRKRDLMLKRR
jgi:hypothetical protein